MNVALIIGNGFDLNIGLPTSYSDFYEYYLKVDSQEDDVDFIKRKIKDTPENWADLEKSLGEITTEYSGKLSEFDAAFGNVRNELEKYLMAVDRYDIPNIDVLASRFLRDVLEVDRFLDNKPKKEYRGFLRDVECNNIVLNVVNFNYTSVVEKFKSVVPALNLEQRKIQLKNIVHVHQDLNTGIIMGVNDESQIADEAFRKSFDIKSMMVKPFINEEFAADNDVKSMEIIRDADVVILFGTSFGETDCKWWDIIANSVYGRRQRIIYCPYEKDVNRPLHETEVIRRIRHFKESLAKKLSFGNSTVESNLIEKIYPIRSNHMFDFGFTNRNRMEARRDIVKMLIPS